MSGFSTIITTASEHNTDMLKSTGATHIISRTLSSSEIVARVSEIVGKGNAVDVIYDAVSTLEMQQTGCDILAPGGRIAVVLPPNPEVNKRGQEKHILHVWNQPQVPRNRELAGKLYGKLTQWLEEGIIVVSVELTGFEVFVPETDWHI